MTANASSSSATSRAEPTAGVDLAASGLLAALPAALLAGRDRDLLSPLGFLAPGTLPAARDGAPPDRRELAAALSAANTAYAHPAAERLAARLADPATRVVVTGQQPGLFGGPLYTLLKAVAASRWAEALEAAGEPAVAVFWVATEDHDFAEVSSATFLAADGPWTLSLGDDPAPLAPLGTRTLGPAVADLLQALLSQPGGERSAAWWQKVGRWYRPDARFGEAFSRLLVDLLGARAPLLLDSMLPAVKAAERPLLARLVERRRQVEEATAAADERIARRGYPLQVAPQPGASPLFLLDRGGRRRVEWRGAEGWALRGSGGGERPVAELAAAIADNPAIASPGVLARPALQDALLGTALFVVGPGELSYLPQAAALYPLLEVAPPAVALRPQALLLEPHQVDQLAGLPVSLAELIGDRTRLDRRLAEQRDAGFVEPARRRIAAEVEALRGPSLALDPNLERPWEKTRDQALRAVDTFAERVMAAAARADATTAGRVDRLRDACLPLGRLQERVICTSHFAARHGEHLGAALFAGLELDPTRLQVVVL